jgi:hypothetical protein
MAASAIERELLDGETERMERNAMLKFDLVKRARLLRAYHLGIVAGSILTAISETVIVLALWVRGWL